MFERFSNGSNRTLLVVTPSDIAGDLGVVECLARFTAPDQGDQFGFFVEALNIPGRVALVVPNAVAVAVREKNQRPLAIALLKAVGVELSLALPNHGIFAGALGFHNSEWLAVVSPQHVIDIARTRFIGHALDFLFMGAAAAQAPAGLLQVVIDVALAGRPFGQIRIGFGGSLIGLAQGCDFSA